MRSPLLLSIAFLFASPGWAINRCAGPDGTFVFQDLPCNGAGQEVFVHPASGAAPVTVLGMKGGKPAVSEADRLNALTAESQKDRRRWDLRDRLVPNAKSALARHKFQCAKAQQDLQSEQFRYVQNLYGKTHAAQIASEMAASAATCETRDRELREDLDRLRGECAQLDCAKQ